MEIIGSAGDDLIFCNRVMGNAIFCVQMAQNGLFWVRLATNSSDKMRFFAAVKTICLISALEWPKFRGKDMWTITW